MKNRLSVYIHWPFCKSKCPYCDFNSHEARAIDSKTWLQAYLTELEYFAHLIDGKEVISIFFGGGTPSLMPPQIVEAIITKVLSYGNASAKIEITLEGNPTSVEARKFVDFKDCGVNRVSLGIQSLRSSDLKFLGRQHNVDEALFAIDVARKTFENFSFDLIYARPNQSLQAWQDELTEALKYADNHLSLYQLTIEKGTKFYSEYKAGHFEIPNEELAADLYLLTNEIMAGNGLPYYEVSNYAKPGFESVHNLTYWQYGDYLGIGPGAHSRVSIDGAKHAMMMTHEPKKWLKLVEEKNNGLQNSQKLTKDEILEEVVMMGLRTTCGINFDIFQNITGGTIENKLHNIDKLLKAELISMSDSRLAATERGILVVNSVIKTLLGG